MKLLRLSLVVASLGSATFAAEPVAPLAPASTITAVTVYRDRAVATRTATVELSTGSAEILFPNLPASLVDQSLQISGRGPATATILDVSVKSDVVDYTPNERVRALEEEMRQLQKQQRIVNDHSLALRAQHATLDRIDAAATSAASKDVPRLAIEDAIKLLEFLADRRARLASEQQALDAETEAFVEKQTALEQQLAEVRGNRSRTVKTVVVRVAAASAGRLDLTLRYTLPGASWTPSYDVRLRNQERAVELTYFGVVRNGTGEDWRDVALTLSTARPNLGGGAPDLPPWIVDVRRPQRIESTIELSQFVVQSSDRFSNTLGRRGQAAASPPPPEPEATKLLANVESGLTSATFTVPVSVTLRSDSTTQKVAIASTSLAATLRYHATPKLIEAAFLGAEAVNTSEYPLLAGPANTFLDDTFVATSQLATVMPGEKFELALGVDDGIAVKRRLINRFAEDTGFTSKSRRITYEFLVTVTNNKKSPERVIVKEAVPVSREEKIVAKLLAPAEREIGTTAAPKEITREAENHLVWRLDLKPGEKREVTLKVSVEHPADLAVAGLD